jgi:hypothetical protein
LCAKDLLESSIGNRKRALCTLTCEHCETS